MSAVAQSQGRIGRFTLKRCLGRGTQGEVWLAHDPHLKREVAIKTVLVEAAQDEQMLKSLLEEAVIVSRLKHPNIVTLYDAGEEGGRPYLIFEYVEGKTLSTLIKEEGKIEPRRAAEITLGILRALQCAHDKDVVHRDIKPGNVMISEAGEAQVMDFGIASLISSSEVTDEEFLGTPLYMAPEYASQRVFTPRSDVFAVGMVFYTMLCGAHAVSGSDLGELLYNLSHATFVPPSKRADGIDERLDAIVLRALAQDPEQRFDSAQRMASELEAWLQPAPKETADGVSGTLEFLLRRMGRKSDFPALSTTLSAVSRSTHAEREGVSTLASSILKDFAFTNKLLKLVNTAFYGQFGGAISTVSSAIMVMGYDQVRSVAVTLMLFEHLQNKAQADHLKDEVLSAYFSALIARDLVAKAGVRDAEQAFICAMFSRLGKLLVTFYLYDEHTAIDQMVRRGLDENLASTQVLGMSYSDLGMGVARTWNFPEKLVASMRPLGGAEVRKPLGEVERLRLISELSTSLTRVIRDVAPEKRSATILSLVERYGKHLGVTDQHLRNAVQNAVGEISRDAGILNFKTSSSAFFNQAKKWGGEGAGAKGGAGGEAKGVDAALQATRVDEPSIVDLPAEGVDTREARQAILRAGFQDVTNALVGEFKLNDVLRIILETMYRSMGFTRTMLLLRDPKGNGLKARFGFGQDVDQYIHEGFAISMEASRDVFYAAVSKGADIYIDDIDGERIRDHVPAWYRKRFTAKVLALFPVMIAKKPVGLFYADFHQVKTVRLEADDLAQLKTLRNQAVLALRSA